jgi:hypothetical protein
VIQNTLHDADTDQALFEVESHQCEINLKRSIPSRYVLYALIDRIPQESLSSVRRHREIDFTGDLRLA